jgi:hypothetical protein
MQLSVSIDSECHVGDIRTAAQVASRGADAYTNTRALTNGVLGLQVCHRDSH